MLQYLRVISLFQLLLGDKLSVTLKEPLYIRGSNVFLVVSTGEIYLTHKLTNLP